MIVDFRTLFFVTAISLTFYWLLPSKNMNARRTVLVSASILFLMSISAMATLILLLMTAYAYVVTRKRSFGLSERWRYILSLGTFLPLVLIEFIDTSLPPGAPQTAAPLIGLGLTFYSLRAYSVVMDSLNQSVERSALDILLLFCAFPTIGAGPIERVNAYLGENIQTRLSGADISFAIYRVSAAVFKAEVVLKVFLQPLKSQLWGAPSRLDWGALPTSELWLCTLIAFVIVYVNFSAYSDLAIGISRLFGIKVRENFNHPYVATNVQLFWRRWHISLGNWLVQYIYTPLVRNTGRPFFAIFLTFTIIGIWHSVTWNYLLWGAMHGAALAWISWSNRKFGSHAAFGYVKELWGYKFLSWFITITFVAIASVFANETSFSRGIDFLIAWVS